MLKKRFIGLRPSFRKAKVWVPVFLAIVALVLPLSLAGLGQKRAHPMAREEVAQEWIGISKDGHYLLCIILNMDGHGRGGYIFLDEEPRTFEIFSWHYESGRIEIIPKPLSGPPSWVRPMNGLISGSTMNVKASEKDWTIDFTLRRKVELQSRWDRLQRKLSVESPM